MNMKKNEFVLYGLDNYQGVIESVISNLNVLEDDFDIKLILTEALTNAFKHGNNGMKDKPIYLRYINRGNNVEFEIEDCGNGYENLIIPKLLIEEDLLNDSGRGLFLLNCIADKIEFRKNTLVIQKQLKI